MINWKSFFTFLVRIHAELGSQQVHDGQTPLVRTATITKKGTQRMSNTASAVRVCIDGKAIVCQIQGSTIKKRHPLLRVSALCTITTDCVGVKGHLGQWHVAFFLQCFPPPRRYPSFKRTFLPAFFHWHDHLSCLSMGFGSGESLARLGKGTRYRPLHLLSWMGFLKMDPLRLHGSFWREIDLPA